VAVERPLLDQRQIEVGRAREDRFLPGPTGDDGEDRDLQVVDQAGSPSDRYGDAILPRRPSPIQRATSMTRFRCPGASVLRRMCERCEVDIVELSSCNRSMAHSVLQLW
jgi:hypothetical protein